jgi:N-acetylglucosaminyl-diphospho-decaprenol L-rhamnosyltransferase
VTPSIDVVIPVHGHYALTDACLRKLDAPASGAQVIVYDDASPDDTASRLAADWPDVRVLAQPPNAGFARAVNRGVAAGHGEAIVVLNNDVEVDPGFLEAIVAPLAADPGLGSVAPVMLQPGRSMIDSVGLACDATLAAFPRLHGLPAGAAGEARPRLVGPSGSAAAYRRSAWDALGGLDEEITSYMEDVDLALRLAAAGWRSAVAPEASGVHLGSATYGHRSARQRGHGGFARGYLLGRYGILKGRAAARTLLTEAIVITADAALNRDLAALRGRLAGARVARRLPRRPLPAWAIDETIGMRRSLSLRRGVYRPPPAGAAEPEGGR